MAKTNAMLKRHVMLPYFLRRFDQVGRKLAFGASNARQCKTWRSSLLKKLRELTGYNTMVRSPLKPRIIDQVACDGYMRQHMEIQTEPGVYMPMYVLSPTDRKGSLPAVIAAHGHCGGGKVAVAGVRDVPEVASAITELNYDYGVQIARAGMIAFCPDARGFGERREHTDRTGLMYSSCLDLRNMAEPLGQTVAGMWAWDLHRLVDYIGTRKDVLPGRVGCAGLSGGGLQTLWAASMDDRIRCAIISGYLYGYKEALLIDHGNCSCNYVPHLYEYADMGDIAAMIAPRPLLIETGDADTLNGKSGLANVRSQVQIIRRAYKALGAADAVKHDIFQGGHRWHGTYAIDWLKQHV